MALVYKLVEPKKTVSNMNKTKIVLRGTVKYVNQDGTRILVQSSERRTSFGISAFKDFPYEGQAGDMHDFCLTPRTFVNKDGHISLTLNMAAASVVDESRKPEEVNALALRAKCRIYDVKQSPQLPNQFLIKAVMIKDDEEQEALHFRFYNAKGIDIQNGIYDIIFDVTKVKTAITDRAFIFNIHNEVKREIDGQEVKVQVPYYINALSISSLTPEGEDDVELYDGE